MRRKAGPQAYWRLAFSNKSARPKTSSRKLPKSIIEKTKIRISKKSKLSIKPI